MDEKAFDIDAAFSGEPENVQLSTGQNDSIKIKKPKNFSQFLVPFALILLVVVGFIYWLFQGGILSIGSQQGGFNIPSEKGHVLLAENGILYSFDVEKEKLTELGAFQRDGNKIKTTYAVVVSPDLSRMVASVPSASGGSELLSFTSFTESESVVDIDVQIREAAVSNNGDVAFVIDGSGAFVYSAFDDIVESLGDGVTPFFLGDASVAVVGTSDGFKVFDLNSKDLLETETPTIPVARAVRSSSTGGRIALVSDGGSVHTYQTLSARPFNLVELSFLVIPGGAYDAAILDDQRLAFLILDSGGSVNLSIYNVESGELTNTELPLTSSVRLLSWTQ